MLKLLCETLLTQYIGAVLIALLGCQALIVIVTLITQIGFWFFHHWSNQAVWDSAGSTFP